MNQTSVIAAHNVTNEFTRGHFLEKSPLDLAAIKVRWAFSIHPAGRSPAFSPTSHKKRTGYGLQQGLAQPDGPIRTSPVPDYWRIVLVSSRPSSPGNAQTSQAHQPHSLKYTESESGPSLFRIRAEDQKGQAVSECTTDEHHE